VKLENIHGLGGPSYYSLTSACVLAFGFWLLAIGKKAKSQLSPKVPATIIILVCVNILAWPVSFKRQAEIKKAVANACNSSRSQNQ